MKPIRVIELFAGVGGFRLGFENVNKKIKSEAFKVVWSNQWEPGKKKQAASDIYVSRFGSDGHSNQDISTVPVKAIPEFDMLVGGFPCQDYSVAKTLNQAQGLEGKKGVLWWEIYRIIQESKRPPKYLLLENVDRLVKSPANQRGRDFAIMLASLSKLGYAVEWRVINAADYGMPQRRRRVFIFGYHRSTPEYKLIEKEKNLSEWILSEGLFASAFPVTADRQRGLFDHPSEVIERDLVRVTKRFNSKGGPTPFENAGVMLDSTYLTFRVEPKYSGRRKTLGDVLVKKGTEIPAEFLIDKKYLPKWKEQKGAKKILRHHKETGTPYYYSEGGMVFPDALDAPSRTIVTGEGGSTPSRFKHAVKDHDGRLRRLLPEELERLNMFPTGHTRGATDNERAFFMGNALVVGIVERIATALVDKIKRAD